MPADWTARVRDMEPRARTTSPASETDLADAEAALGCVFPADLRELLLQTNGVLDEYFGPVLPLWKDCAAPFVAGDGTPVTQAGFPAYDMVGYTQMLRSDEFARLNGWGAETTEMFQTFVVIGVDVGGGTFGFFAGDAAEDGEHVRVYFVEHDTAEEGDTYSLEAYLHFFFAEAALFGA